MVVTQVQIRQRAPYAAGEPFGPAGPYERLDGIVHFAVAPAHRANAGIVDLDQAPVDSERRVRFSADFCLLQPVDPQRGNGRLLLDIPNRGRKVAVRTFNRARPDPSPAEAIDPGDGFLFRHGWTVATCGWQWDVPRSPALLGLEAPVAQGHGAPLQGQVVVEFQPNAPCRDQLLANRVHHPYPIVDVDDPEAVLTVREWMDGPRSTIARHRWRFARDRQGEPQPDDSYVWLDDGFMPGRLYEVIYRTRLCLVVGAGLLAVRDCAAWLRYGTGGTGEAGNPCAGRIATAYGFGVSQTGRFLRHFLYLGLN
ncbi:MAG: alpha/beta hydrolase domain-containing protein, partial [Chloroflexota bacterium]